ncbi:hypothetical protein HED22_05740 [Thalassospira sp. HF15]|uniref:hypothetical protein n=1 Tax=Thalassospira sp. HF15 TaxID=2722755 RepID=UPI0014315DCE|nr:hypothetical protein [Thalassospira sp. HF15]NIY75140.1 hypothetical protein [Thalassospira sp. HF15]
MSESDKEIKGPKVPAKEVCTAPGFRFFERHWKIFDFLFFASNLARTQDESRKIALKALSLADPEKYDVGSDKERRGAFKRLQQFRDYQTENMCIRLSDNFLCYLSEIIQACALKNPNIIKSKEQLSVEDILNFKRNKDIIRFVVDKKINGLTYGGVNDIDNFIMSRIGFSILEDENAKNIISYSVNLRNLYTHNRGIVDNIFKRKMKGNNLYSPCDVGDLYEVDYDDLVVIANNYYNICQELDLFVSEKFGLKRKRFSTWAKSKTM